MHRNIPLFHPELSTWQREYGFP